MKGEAPKIFVSDPVKKLKDNGLASTFLRPQLVSPEYFVSGVGQIKFASMSFNDVPQKVRDEFSLISGAALPKRISPTPPIPEGGHEHLHDLLLRMVKHEPHQRREIVL